MKDPKDMTDDELESALNSFKDVKDPKDMTDEELEYVSKGLSDLENLRGGLAKGIHLATYPVQKALNAIDYFTGAPIRAAAIEGKKEYDKPKSTPGSIVAAALRGPVEGAMRNPLDYDPNTSYAELAKQYGVTEAPVGEFTKSIEPFVPDVIEQTPVNQAVGLAGEMLLDPSTVAMRTMKPMGTALKEASVVNAEKALVRASGVPAKDMVKLIDDAKLQSVAKTMQEEGLIKNIDSPEKLREKLVGKTISVPHPGMPGKRIIKKVTEGLLDKVGSELNESISKMDKEFKDSGLRASKRDLINVVLDEVNANNESLRSGTVYSPSDRKLVQDTVEGVFKSKIGGDNLSVKDLVDIKRGAQEYIYDLSKQESFGVQGAKSAKNTYKVIEKKLNDYLNNLAITSKVDKKTGMSFLKNNQRYSDLATLKKIIDEADVTAMKEIGLAEHIPGALAAGGVGLATGLNPAVMAGGYAMGREISRAASGKMPANLAKVQDVLVKPPLLPGTEGYLNIAQRPAGLMRAVTGSQVERKPQSLPMQLVEYQIPRNSDEILANKDVVIAKIAQMSNNPALTEMFEDSLNKYPEKLKKVLPAIILQFPDLFEDDDYNRIDGKIFDPALKQKALKDIKNNKNMSLRERALLSKKLEEEGVYEGN